MKHSGRWNRTAAFFLAVLLASASLSACGRSRVSGAKPSSVLRSEDRGESGEIEFPCINPVLLTPVKEDYKDCSVEYPYLSGLANTGLQDGINNLISGFAAEIAGRDAEDFGRPFCDIKIVGDPLARSVRIRGLWNCNDVISLVASDSTQNMNADYLSLYPKTIDLRTGAELRLSDLFLSGADYKKIIDLAVKKALSSHAVQYDPLRSGREDCERFFPLTAKLSAGYAGVTDETPFFLHDGGLAIVLKYDADGLIFTGTHDEIVTIGFEKFAGSWKIADGRDGELYSDPGEVSFSLVYADMGNILSESEDRSFGCELAHLEDSVYYPENFPEKLVGIAKSMLAEFRIDDDKAKAACGKKMESWVYASNIVSCRSIGGLYMLKQNITENISAPKIWFRSERCRIFDDQLKEIHPKELFGNQNYKAFFREKLRSFIACTYEAEGYLLKTAEGEPLGASGLDSLIENASFSVSPREFSIITGPVLVEREGEQPTYRSLILSAAFSEFGFQQHLQEYKGKGSK